MVEITEHLKKINGKVTGHYEEIDGYNCFVGKERGEKVIYTKQPISEYKAEIEKAKKRMALLKSYGEKLIDINTFFEQSSNL